MRLFYMVVSHGNNVMRNFILILKETIIYEIINGTSIRNPNIHEHEAVNFCKVVLMYYLIVTSSQWYNYVPIHKWYFDWKTNGTAIYIAQNIRIKTSWLLKHAYINFI